jgi:hypothetical protein
MVEVNCLARGFPFVDVLRRHESAVERKAEPTGIVSRLIVRRLFTGTVLHEKLAQPLVDRIGLPAQSR